MQRRKWISENQTELGELNSVLVQAIEYQNVVQEIIVGIA
jgi:hypothetical protein